MVRIAGLTLLYLVVASSLIVRSTIAEETAAKDPFTEQTRAEAATYEFALADEASTPLQLRATPVLEWTNPVSGSIRGRVFLWTVAGRPELIASIYEIGGRPGISVECHSLSPGRITGKRDDGTAWNPQSEGVTLKRVDPAPRPAESAAGRLTQMRALAASFSAQRTDPDGTRWELRLMRQPLYRYHDDRGELVDGAVFCFAQGTNPDVILLLEARREENGLIWQYGLARMHHRRLDVQRNGGSVAEFAELERSSLSDPSQPYFVFRRGF